MSSEVIKTDDTDAFDGHFGAIKILNPKLKAISRIEVVTNSGACIKNKRYTDENDFKADEIVLTIDYSSDETARLNQGSNTLNVVAFDKQGRQLTSPQTFVFNARNGVISKNGRF